MTSHAQLSDKLVPRMGFMYEFVTFQLPTVAEPNVRDFYNFHLGTFVALAHKNDIVSVGVDPSIHFGFNLFNTGNSVAFDYNVQTPVLAMGRLGAGATPYNQQRFGVGLGIGGQYTFFNRTLINLNKIKAGFFNPIIAGEISFVSRSGPITIRGVFSIADATGALKNTNINGATSTTENTKFGNWGIGLLYGF